MRSLVRLQLLSKLTATLGELGSEWEVDGVIRRALPQIYEPTALVELYLTHGDDELLSNGAGRTLDDLRTRIRSLDVGENMAQARARLRAPHLISADPEGSHGPIMTAPLIMRSVLLGVLLVERPSDAPEFTFGDLETLSVVAGQAAIALYHARRRLTARRLRIAEDLQQAREIQRGFLPTLPPQMGRLHIASAYRPAFAVGGDFFDVVESPDGAITIIVGDVAGSGVAAALLMSRISSDVRRLARDGRQPAEILQEISRTLHDSAPDHGFVTASCLRIDPGARTAMLATAAHLPILLRRGPKRVELHRGQAGLPLGVFDGERWPEVAIPLELGDVMVLCTDGVVEALSHEASPAGVLKLAGIVKDAPLPVELLAGTVLSAIDSSERAHVDDLTLLVLQVAQ